MGFGVVHPTLPVRISFALVALGALYLLAGITAAVKSETTYDTSSPSAWELPVLALDLVFLALIQGHHSRTTASLKGE